MIRISEIMLYVFLFFLLSTGFFLLVSNVAVSNTKLSEQSQDDLKNLNIYYEKTSNPFNNESKNINYSLSKYANTDDFAQSNIETKGGLTSILNMLNNDKNQISALSAPIIFLNNMLPLPTQSLSWSYPMIASFLGVIVIIAFFAAWKGGVF